ncbi:MAG: hypothetical protein KDA55_21205 [Planctomycetales bacterium]|nr:hypothetical protein [Planctomycetales bacterium]
MHFSARKITAAFLAALLAALACFEHALHEFSHVGSASSCCAHGKLPFASEDGVCSHHHGFGKHDFGKHISGNTETPTDPPAPVQHDTDRCPICRVLNLPQLFEAPPTKVFAEALVFGDVAESYQSFAAPFLTLAAIRGPPPSELQNPC